MISELKKNAISKLLLDGFDEKGRGGGGGGLDDVQSLLTLKK